MLKKEPKENCKNGSVNLAPENNITADDDLDEPNKRVECSSQNDLDDVSIGNEVYRSEYVEKINTDQSSGKDIIMLTKLIEENDDCDIFSELSRDIELVGDLKETSVDEIFVREIEYGKKFVQWQKSNRGLDNVQFYYRVGNKRTLVNVTRKTDIRDNNLATSFGFLAPLDAYLEIWECDAESNDLKFPLYRFSLNKCLLNQFQHTERLRDDISINLEAELKDNIFVLRISCDKQSAWELFLEKIKLNEILPTPLVRSANNNNSHMISHTPRINLLGHGTRMLVFAVTAIFAFGIWYALSTKTYTGEAVTTGINTTKNESAKQYERSVSERNADNQTSTETAEKVEIPLKESKTLNKTKTPKRVGQNRHPKKDLSEETGALTTVDPRINDEFFNAYGLKGSGISSELDCQKAITADLFVLTAQVEDEDRDCESEKPSKAVNDRLNNLNGTNSIAIPPKAFEQTTNEEKR
jgi:hypothetical protein